MGEVATGLEGIVVAETQLSSVDGERGVLILRGERVEDLAGVCSFEAVLARLHDRDDEDGWRQRLGRARVEAAAHLVPSTAADPMDALRAGLARLPESEDPAALLGAGAVIVAAWDRQRRGLSPVAPDPERGHAADLLALVRGEAPSPAAAAALDAYLVAVIDHGFNASTFTARVIASTGSDLVSACVGAVGALKGPLHGGAPGPVLDMLDAVGAPERADDWVAAELAEGRRIMGMGHRVYRVRDPRATVLERALLTLDAAEPDPTRAARLALAKAVEAAALTALRARHPERALHANVEFYTALLLESLGLDRALFPAVFACARLGGWTAHVTEQKQGGRLIRPRARYVGARPT